MERERARIEGDGIITKQSGDAAFVPKASVNQPWVVFYPQHTQNAYGF
jgi:hypothetical protein